MKYRVVTERIGENMGPIDWNYDFMYHYGGHCCPEATKVEYCNQAKGLLKVLEEAKKRGELELYEADTDGFAFRKVVDVGMYDGWPFWRPTPSICVWQSHGAEWKSFDHLKAIRRLVVKPGGAP